MQKPNVGTSHARKHKQPPAAREAASYVGACFRALALCESERNHLRQDLCSTLAQAAVAFICVRGKPNLTTALAITLSLVLMAAQRLLRFKRTPTSTTTVKALLAITNIAQLTWLHYWWLRVQTTEGVSPLGLVFVAHLAIEWGALLETTCAFVWPTRPIILLGFSIYFALIKLVIYAVLTGLLLTRSYLPVHVLRDAYAQMRLSLSQMTAAVSYRRAKLLYGISELRECSAPLCCPICLEGISTDTLYTLTSPLWVNLSCGHTSHLSCVYRWCKQLDRPSCPVCRGYLKGGTRCAPVEHIAPVEHPVVT